MKQFFSQTAMILFISVFLFALQGSGCKKSGGSSGQYYVKFKANGVQQEYRSDDISRIWGGNNGGKPLYAGTPVIYGFEVQGYGDPIQAYPSAQVQIRSSKAVKTDSLYLTTNGSGGNTVDVYYSEKVDTYEKVINYISSKNVQVKISEIGDKTIQGTFSGTVYTADGTRQAQITEGVFFVLRNN